MSLLQSSFNVARGFSLCVVISFIIQFFALAQAKLDLHPTVLKIKRQRNKRHALLHNSCVELDYLALMHEQSSRAHRVFIKNVALFIRAYMQRSDKQLAVFDRAVAVLNKL